MGGAEGPDPALPIAASTLGFVIPNPASLPGSQYRHHGSGIPARNHHPYMDLAFPPWSHHPSLGAGIPAIDPASIPGSWHPCHGSGIAAMDSASLLWIQHPSLGPGIPASWPATQQLEFHLGLSCISSLWSPALCTPSKQEHGAVWVGGTRVPPSHGAP